MLLLFCVAKVCFVIIFCMVAKVLLCSYQGVLSVVVVFFCVATVCFCYNIPYGCQGVAMQLSRCSVCCCFFVLLKYVFVIMFCLVAKVFRVVLLQYVFLVIF